MDTGDLLNSLEKGEVLEGCAENTRKIGLVRVVEEGYVLINGK